MLTFLAYLVLTISPVVAPAQPTITVLPGCVCELQSGGAWRCVGDAAACDRLMELGPSDDDDERAADESVRAVDECDDDDDDDCGVS